jgi:hypothetical protein
VNATPANALVPLSLVKDHSAATGPTIYGYVWRLGHPQTPVLLSFSNSSKAQGYNSSSSSARLQLGLVSAYTNDSSNGGYGSFSETLFSVNAGLSHYASDGTPAWDLAGLTWTPKTEPALMRASLPARLGQEKPHETQTPQPRADHP